MKIHPTIDIIIRVLVVLNLLPGMCFIIGIIDGKAIEYFLSAWIAVGMLAGFGVLFIVLAWATNPRK